MNPVPQEPVSASAGATEQDAEVDRRAYPKTSIGDRGDTAESETRPQRRSATSEQHGFLALRALDSFDVVKEFWKRTGKIRNDMDRGLNFYSAQEKAMSMALHQIKQDFKVLAIDAACEPWFDDSRQPQEQKP